MTGKNEARESLSTRAQGNPSPDLSPVLLEHNDSVLSRCVALLDVLGFSALVGGDGSSNRLSNYHKCVEGQFRYGEKFGIDYSAFSDSIILTTRSDSTGDVQAICAAVSKLYADLLTINIAIRGALAYGQVYRTSAGGSTFVAGKPVIEAFDFEKKQAWVGVMLAPSLVKRIVDAEGKLKADLDDTNTELPKLDMSLNRWNRIPMQISSQFEEYDGFAVVPISAWKAPDSISTSLFGSGECLSRMRLMAPDPRTQAKYTRAVEFINFVRKRYDPNLR